MSQGKLAFFPNGIAFISSALYFQCPFRSHWHCRARSARQLHRICQGCLLSRHTGGCAETHCPESWRMRTYRRAFLRATCVSPERRGAG